MIKDSEDLEIFGPGLVGLSLSQEYYRKVVPEVVYSPQKGNFPFIASYGNVFTVKFKDSGVPVAVFESKLVIVREFSEFVETSSLYYRF